MGIASGDRPIEFPAYGLQHDQRAERFAQAVADFRRLLQPGRRAPDLAARPHHRRRTPAQARRRPHPLLVTGASGQSPDWIAAHADGWLTYPGSSVVPAGPKALGQKIQAWRDRIPDGGFRPHATNEWIDLVDDPTHPPTLLHGGFILQIGRHALIDLLAMADCRRQPRRPGHPHAAPPPKPSRNWRRKCCRASRRMRMCRHWIWIGRRDCESSVRTAIRMNGEQQATQHTPTLTARQGTPSTTNTPTTQPCRNWPPARPVSAGDANPAPTTAPATPHPSKLAAPRAGARLRATSMRPRESEGSRRRRQRG